MTHKKLISGAPVRGLLFAKAEASPAELITKLKAEFNTGHETVMAKIKEIAEAGDNVKTEAVAAAEKAVTDVQAMADSLVELEQKITAGIYKGEQAPKNTGQLIVASDQFKAFATNPTSNASFRMEVQANTITGQEGSPPANSDTLVRTDRRPGIVPGAFRALRILDLLTQIPTSSNLWDFTREATFVNNAAETAEATAKPESVITFEKLSVAIRTIPHFIKASKQILADAPAVEAYINTRMLYGVDAREDNQLLNGDGTGENISGMTASGNFTAFTPTSGDQALDSLNRAKYAIGTSDYAADGVIMNPTDWGAIERLKGSDATYLVGNPFGSITPIVWGLPVALSNNVASGKFMMADFMLVYDYLLREGTTIQMGFENDDFTKNLVTILAEKRSALATMVPAATRYGDLTL